MERGKNIILEDEEEDLTQAQGGSHMERRQNRVPEHVGEEDHTQGSPVERVQNTASEHVEGPPLDLLDYMSNDNYSIYEVGQGSNLASSGVGDLSHSSGDYWGLNIGFGAPDIGSLDPNFPFPNLPFTGPAAYETTPLTDDLINLLTGLPTPYGTTSHATTPFTDQTLNLLDGPAPHGTTPNPPVGTVGLPAAPHGTTFNDDPETHVKRKRKPRGPTKTQKLEAEVIRLNEELAKREQKMKELEAIIQNLQDEDARKSKRQEESEDTWKRIAEHLTKSLENALKSKNPGDNSDS